MLLEADSAPTVDQIVTRFGIDEAVAGYVLNYSQQVVEELRKVDPDMTAKKFFSLLDQVNEDEDNIKSL